MVSDLCVAAVQWLPLSLLGPSVVFLKGLGLEVSDTGNSFDTSFALVLAAPPGSKPPSTFSQASHLLSPWVSDLYSVICLSGDG